VLYTTCGTPNYVAPEVLEGAGYEGIAADVWSCGVILYVLLAGFLPFDEAVTDVLFKKIKKAQFKYPPWFTSGPIDLISGILVVDPRKRLTIPQIKQHHWFKVNDNTTYGGSVKGPQSNNFTEIDDELHDLEQQQKFPSINGLTITNAFDLISMTGSLDLSIMLHPKSPDRVKRYTRFTSEADPRVLLEKIAHVLSKYQVDFKVYEKTHKIRVEAPTSKGLLTFTVQILLLAPQLHMVDFSKSKGDILEFYKLYKRIHDQCSDIACKEHTIKDL